MPCPALEGSKKWGRLDGGAGIIAGTGLLGGEAQLLEEATVLGSAVHPGDGLLRFLGEMHNAGGRRQILGDRC